MIDNSILGSFCFYVIEQIDFVNVIYLLISISISKEIPILYFNYTNNK